MSTVSTAPDLTGAYTEQFAGSLARYELAQQSLAGGIAHDGRFMKPFPLHIERADGAYKWDVDGNRLIDYAIGHGSLILGHNDPDITAAMHAQLDKGTHYSAGHEAEILWAQQVQKMLPSADLVRFTGSGTESNLLAMRLARAYTGKPSMLKFEGHFHGWSDYLIKGEKPPFESPGAAGVPEEVMRTVAVLPPDDLGAVEERLAQGDIAAILVEPSGASWSMIPLAEGTLAGLRQLADKYDAVLLFDEVITGFRWAPGGAQERFGVSPDLTTMAKIVAGGMPGGAVAGKKEIMEYLLFKDDAAWNAKKVIHPGTYNANPLAATAGFTCLQKCEDPSVQQTCDDLAAQLRSGFNAIFEARGIEGCSWGESSVFHLIVGEPCSNRTAGDLRAPKGIDPAVLKASGKAGLAMPLTLAMAVEGVDLFNGGGLLSVKHTKDDVDFTLKAFDNSLTRLAESGYLS